MQFGTIKKADYIFFPLDSSLFSLSLIETSPFLVEWLGSS